MSTHGNIAYCYKFDDAEFDEVQRALHVSGKLVELEPKPLALLLALVRQPGEVLTREELLAELWQGRVTVPNVLANAISKLRDALGPRAAARIVTVPKVGYRFDGALVRQVLGRPKTDSDAAFLVAGNSVPGRSTSYVLETKLGTATRHAVWRARHVGLDETRVFKFALNGDQLASLKRELTITRYLAQNLGERENITYITDSNFSEPPFFIEYPDFGTDLAQWAQVNDRWKTMGIDERLGLFIQIARIVADAHALGVFHKDIKPSNILLTDTESGPHIRLGDFGSGRFSESINISELNIPVMGMTVTDVHTGAGAEGTWAYMAPEVQRGAPFTAAADVYALGLLLFQFIAGDLGRTLASDWRKAVNDPELESDVEAATISDPKHRTLSAAQLLGNLLALDERRQARLQAQQEAARQAETEKHAQRVRVRRPWVLASTGLLVLAAVSASWLSYQLNDALKQAKAAQQRSEAMAEFLLTDVFRSADLTRAEAGAIPAAGLSAVLHAASKRASTRFAGQPEVEAIVRSRLADAFARAHAPAAAEEYERALKLFASGPVKNQQAQVQVNLSYAKFLAGTGKLTQTRALIDAQEPYFKRVSLEEAPLIWALKYSAEAALAHAQLNASEELKFARLFHQTVEKLPEVSTSARHSALTILADASARAGHIDEAALLFVRATTAPYLPEAVGSHEWSFTKGRQALLAVQVGRLEEAQTFLDAARTVYRQLPEPTQGLTFDLLVTQAYIDELKGRLPQAGQAYREAAQFAIKAFGQNSPIAAGVSANAAVMASYLDDPSAALDLLNTEIARSKSISAADGATTASLATSLLDFHRAVALTRLGRASEALRILEQMDGAALSKEDAASGWDARLEAERTRAKMVIRKDPSLHAAMETHVSAMAKAGAPEWVIKRYQQRP